MMQEIGFPVNNAFNETGTVNTCDFSSATVIPIRAKYRRNFLTQRTTFLDKQTRQTMNHAINSQVGMVSRRG